MQNTLANRCQTASHINGAVKWSFHLRLGLAPGSPVYAGAQHRERGALKVVARGAGHRGRGLGVGPGTAGGRRGRECPPQPGLPGLPALPRGGGSAQARWGEGTGHGAQPRCPPPAALRKLPPRPGLCPGELGPAASLWRAHEWGRRGQGQPHVGGQHGRQRGPGHKQSAGDPRRRPGPPPGVGCPGRDAGGRGEGCSGAPAAQRGGRRRQNLLFVPGALPASLEQALLPRGQDCPPSLGSRSPTPPAPFLWLRGPFAARSLRTVTTWAWLRARGPGPSARPFPSARAPGSENMCTCASPHAETEVPPAPPNVSPNFHLLVMPNLYTKCVCVQDHNLIHTGMPVWQLINC